MLQLVFVSDAARSVDKENEHSPLCSPIPSISDHSVEAIAYTLYIEKDNHHVHRLH